MNRMITISEVKLFCGADLPGSGSFIILGKVPMVYELCTVYWSFVIPLSVVLIK